MCGGNKVELRKVERELYEWLHCLYSVNWAARVAQLAERVICNHQVRGSNPLPGSKQKIGGMPERPNGVGCKPIGRKAFPGSNPGPPTREAGVAQW